MSNKSRQCFVTHEKGKALLFIDITKNLYTIINDSNVNRSKFKLGLARHLILKMQTATTYPISAMVLHQELFYVMIYQSQYLASWLAQLLHRWSSQMKPITFLHQTQHNIPPTSTCTLQNCRQLESTPANISQLPTSTSTMRRKHHLTIQHQTQTSQTAYNTKTSYIHRR